ncbi:FIST signal transduction protein [Congregicoccus parvus]|uniref:FIST signal transduction protein n=1 Tax=Congregicoccus parvus TaxID=3081749 RepID=UPI003FA5ABBE
MRIEQRSLRPDGSWSPIGISPPSNAFDLVLAWGDRTSTDVPSVFAGLRAMYPQASIVIASSSGQIRNDSSIDDEFTATAIGFDHTRVLCAEISIESSLQSREAGASLAARLCAPELVHVLVVSDGACVNGADLAAGMAENLPAGVTMSGGLAGDGVRFERTVVGLDRTPTSGTIVAVGLYGNRLQVRSGIGGGWEQFGPERSVTRAAGSVLHALDGQPALELYKQYLGEQAAQLPSAALRFPLAVQAPGETAPVVRTILSIDEVARTMTFAGDIPEGSRVSMMRASYEDLVDGAEQAAQACGAEPSPQFALCVSCVGRRIVLGQRIEEEAETVRQVLGPATFIAGFYSYGELAPVEAGSRCRLHNQTMTITTFAEI